MGTKKQDGGGRIGRDPEHWAAELLLNRIRTANSGCMAAYTADMQGPLNRERIMYNVIESLYFFSRFLHFSWLFTRQMYHNHIYSNFFSINLVSLMLTFPHNLHIL